MASKFSSKFSNNNSVSYCASPSNKNGGGKSRGVYLLHGLEGVLDDLAQTEVRHNTPQHNKTLNNTPYLSLNTTQHNTLTSDLTNTQTHPILPPSYPPFLPSFLSLPPSPSLSFPFSLSGRCSSRSTDAGCPGSQTTGR